MSEILTPAVESDNTTRDEHSSFGELARLEAEKIVRLQGTFHDVVAELFNFLVGLASSEVQIEEQVSGGEPGLPLESI